MKTAFTDQQGRDWNLRITIPRAKKLRDAGFDIMDVEKFSKAISDIFDSYEIIWHLVSDQAKDREFTADKFAEEIYAECAEDAHAALVGAVTDFSQKHGRKALGAAMQRIYSAAQEAETKRMQMVESDLMTKAITTTIDRELDLAEKELREMSGETSKDGAT